MPTAKMTVVLDATLLAELRQRLPPRARSAFIGRAVRRELAALRTAALEQAYREAFGETREEAEDLEGTAGDGLA